MESSISDTQVENITFLQDPTRSYKDDLKELEEIIDNRKIVKGLKETLRAIETKKAEKVYLGVDAFLEKYKLVISEYCSIFNVPLIRINKWIELRDIVFKTHKNFKSASEIAQKKTLSNKNKQDAQLHFRTSTQVFVVSEEPELTYHRKNTKRIGSMMNIGHKNFEEMDIKINPKCYCAALLKEKR